MKPAAQFAIASEALDAVYAKIAKRIIPMLIFLFVVAWLDRVNVGFAKLQMVKDLDFSEAAYGFGAGIFYLGYLLFEIPSNLFLERIGARKTLARITILWGLTSIATMRVRTPGSFYSLRFLLGACEAGLYPGVILYLTWWFPRSRRAQMLGYFQTAIPIASIAGSLLSGWIMSSLVTSATLANWQWLFLLEGVPSLIAGMLTLLILVDKPGDAPWLSTSEKDLVIADLDADTRAAGHRKHDFGDALKVPAVWLLSLIYFCVVCANPTLGFWVPTIIQSLGAKSNLTIGMLSAVPYAIGVIATVMVGRHSDRTLERRWHCGLSCLTAAVGLVLTGLLAGFPVLSFAALIVAVSGTLSSFAPFWQMPTVLLAGAAAAGGIALINSLGNLSGWFGPSIVGWLADVTGRTAAGLYVVAGLETVAMVLIVCCIPRPRTAREADQVSA